MTEEKLRTIQELKALEEKIMAVIHKDDDSNSDIELDEEQRTGLNFALWALDFAIGKEDGKEYGGIDFEHCEQV